MVNSNSSLIQPASIQETVPAAQTLSVADIISQAEQIARGGDFEGALNMIVRHKADNPRSAALWRAEGMLLIALRRHKEAQGLLCTALSLDPQDSRIVCGLGICAKEEGNQAAAHDLFVRSLQLDRNNKIAILQLLAVAYELNNFTTLESVLRAYLSANAEELDLTYALAGCLFRQNKIEEARSLCAQIILKSPGHSGAKELIELISQSGSQAAAGSAGSQTTTVRQGASIEANPSNVTSGSQRSVDSKVMERIFRIADLKRNHKITQGIQECSSLLGDLTPDAPELEEIYALQGELLALDGQVAESERRFNSILGQFPNSIRALCGLGALYGEQGSWTRAEECFRKAIALNPRCDVGFAGLALSSIQAGDKEAAWHYYEKALSVNPENLRAVFGILELGYPEARYNDIERVLRNYLELHPANLDFLYSLAGCFYAQGKLPEASQEIEKILMFSPEHPKAMELREAIQTRLSR